MSAFSEFIHASSLVSKLLLDNEGNTLKEVLKILGKTTKISRATIFEADSSDTNILVKKHEYFSPEYPISLRELITAKTVANQKISLTLSNLPDLEQLLLKGSTLSISDLSRYPHLPHFKPLLLLLEIKALLIIPIIIKNKIHGFVGFEDIHRTRDWQSHVVEFLEANIDCMKSFIQRNLILSKLNQAESEVRRSEKRYRELFEHAPVGIFRTTSSGDVLQANNEMVKILGLSSEMEVKERFQDLQKTLYVDPQRRVEFLQKLNQDGKIENFVFKAKNANNKEIWLSMSARKLEDLENGTFVIEGFDFDITQQKKAEEILHHMERLSSLGEFASGVAHDFNNTLQGILGNLELVFLDDNLTLEQKDSLKTLKKLAIDAAARIRQLQRFSGKRRGPLTLNNISSHSIIHDVIDQTRFLWQSNSDSNFPIYSIETHLDKDVSIQCNSGEIRVVFYNIIKNSIQAMPEGGTISIETRLQEDFLFITISDTGIGMDEKTQSKIFVPFFTTKRFEQGIGLGMSGAYSIIKEHGGVIFVKNSELNKGTSIEFSLKIAKSVKKTKPQLSQEIPQANILWVDDELTIRKYARSLVQKLNHNIDIAENGKDALKLLTANTYDLLITDIGMPVMNGWELLKKLKNRDSNMYIAILTGWGDNITEEMRNKYHVDYVIGKPMQAQQLISILSQIMIDK